MASSQHKPRIFQIALTGGDSLLGRDLTEVFERHIKGALVTSYSSSGESAIGENEGEAVFLDALDEKTAAEADVIVTAGAEQGSLKAFSLAKARSGQLPVIDCSGHLEHQPDAVIVSPIPGEPNPPGAWLFVTAHPAAAAAATTLERLARYRTVSKAIVHIFEPASERGKAGAAELHQQTTGLLAFRSIDKDIFDAQVSFNLLAEYGPAAPLKLASIERRIEQHVAALLAKSPAALVQPSIRLVQAPVFHAYSLSFWVEFAASITAQEISHALASAQIEVRDAKDEPPNGIAAAGHDGLIAGDIRIDRNNPRAVWIWTVCDNLRVTANAALAVLQALKSAKDVDARHQGR